MTGLDQQPRQYYLWPGPARIKPLCLLNANYEYS
jgi:hypothetical protein